MHPATRKPWADIAELVRNKAGLEEIERLLNSIPPDQLLHAVYLLTPTDRQGLFAILPVERAAEMLEDVSDTYAAELMENMTAEDAAEIVGELASDHRVDVLAELNSEDAEAIIAELDEEDADEIRVLIAYDPDQAGGLMITEFVTWYSLRPTGKSVSW